MNLALFGGTPVRQKPFSSWPMFESAEEESLTRILRSRLWGGYNKEVEEFELAFAAMHRTSHAISCANGTVALEVALRAAGVECGDEVIVPPFTFVATATSVLLCHGSPVFADIDPVTLNLSPAAAEAAITPRTRAIVVVHFGGHPADMDAFTALAKKHGIALIEDCAHAHGATWGGVPVGNFGLAGTFSFQAFKLITSGEGGIVLTNSPEIAESVWAYCNQGRRKNSGWFEHYTLGSNYRLTAFQAALLDEQLKKLPGQTRTRAQNVQYLREQIADLPGFRMEPVHPKVQNHPHYLVTLRYRASEMEGVSRATILQALQAEGIPAVPTYPHPLYRNPLFTTDQLPPCRCGSWKPGQDYRSLNLAESERACRDGLWLEHNVFLGTKKDIDDIVAAFHKVQQNATMLRRQETDTINTVVPV
jgi:dTDP-4-amino-4,6-dideoxygalactose transaminase